jgi:S-adenosylmethionine-diacylglycerol 3-amino-3-carboxypropyl transferase
LRPENFELIRERLDRLEWHGQSLESFLETCEDRAFDAFNLSDIFEYISPANTHRLLERIARAGRSGARLAYWNTLVERSRPESLAGRLRSLEELSRSLHARDRAFFYCAFVVEEVV